MKILYNIIFGCMLFFSCGKCTEMAIQNNTKSTVNIKFYQYGQLADENSFAGYYTLSITCDGPLFSYANNYDSVQFLTGNKSITYYSDTTLHNVPDFAYLPCKNFFNFHCWESKVKRKGFKNEKTYVFSIDEADFTQ